MPISHVPNSIYAARKAKKKKAKETNRHVEQGITETHGKDDEEEKKQVSFGRKQKRRIGNFADSSAS